MRPKPRFLVTSAIAGTSCNGSLTGICVECAKRGVEIAAVDVVDAEHVGDEQAVELAALQDLGELDPIFEILVLPGTVARMRP